MGGDDMTDDTAARRWQDLREVLIQAISDRLKEQPEDQREIWDLSCEECATSFPEVMQFVDEMFGCEPIDWLKVQINLENGTWNTTQR